MAGWSESGKILAVIVVTLLPFAICYCLYNFIKIYMEDKREKILGNNQEKQSLRMAGLSRGESLEEATANEAV